MKPAEAQSFQIDMSMKDLSFPTDTIVTKEALSARDNKIEELKAAFQRLDNGFPKENFIIPASPDFKQSKSTKPGSEMMLGSREDMNVRLINSNAGGV